MMQRRERLKFTGHIAGTGTAQGTRMVLGCWSVTDHGPFADVMVAHPSGHRQLLAPDAWVADLVSGTYTFDEVSILPVSVERTGTQAGSQWQVHAGPLNWTFQMGPRHLFGYGLRGVPRTVMAARWFAPLTNLVAPALIPGVRTLGSAGGGRTEWYGATDLHRMASSRVSWAGEDLGPIRPVSSPPDFGFSSTPAMPSVTALTSTIELPAQQ